MVFSRPLSLPAGTPLGALLVNGDLLVLRKTVIVLSLALVGSRAVVVIPPAKRALLVRRPGRKVEVRLVVGSRPLPKQPAEDAAEAAAAAAAAAAALAGVEAVGAPAGADVPPAGAAGAAVGGLAALCVDGDAVVVLGLAGVCAGVGDLCARVAGAAAAVAVGVQLEGVVCEVVAQVVAGDDGQLDAADGVAGPVAVLVAGGLLADVGDGRDGALRGGGGGRSRGGGAGHGDGLGGRGLAALGGLVGEAVLLVEDGALAAGRAIVADVAAPAGEVEAVHGAGEAGVLQAGGDLDLAAREARLAAVDVAPVGQLVRAPLAASVLAAGGDGGGGHADGLGGGGGRGRGCGWGHIAAGLQGLEVLGDVEGQTASAAAGLLCVSVAGHRAVGFRGRLAEVSKNLTTPTLTCSYISAITSPAKCTQSEGGVFEDLPLYSVPAKG